MAPTTKTIFTGREVDLAAPIDISIPLNFDGPQPNAYGAKPATSRACESGDLVGDTLRGGSCNFEQYTLIPHCNGTHTECVGHITHERISVMDCLKDVFIPAVLISVEPKRAIDAGERYASSSDETDLVITARTIEQGWSKLGWHKTDVFGALVIRTHPNSEDKLARRYGDDIPPYFMNDAIQLIVSNGFSHLLVDLPSIDRMFDEGKLSNHRIFWNVEPGSFETNPGTRRNSTITELIYVPNTVSDGLYMLNLQIAPFASDASPSRPVLFPFA
jgi:kynurenine formamidase